MTERATELSSLEQEVAELWSRYRQAEPSPDDAVEKHALGAQVRALETKQRSLAERRLACRSALEAERRRVSAFAPILLVCGALVGLVVTALAVAAVLPTVATWSLTLDVAHGAVTIGLATLSLPFLLASR